MSDTDDRDRVTPDPLAPPIPMAAHATLSVETEQELPAHAEHDRGTLLATMTLGGVMLVGAVVVLVDAASLRPSDEFVGPAAVPTVVGCMLGLLGALLVLQAVRRLRTSTVREEPLPHRRLVRLAAMVVLLIVFAFLLPVVGYVVASALLFTGAALLLGAPYPARTAAYGWTLAGVVFLIFDRLIGLALPTGPWGF
ncbi:MAG: tripartite tricarboxylate transporter TctB family protein [Actinoplanes sp.]